MSDGDADSRRQDQRMIRSHEPEGELLSFIGSYRFILLSRVSVNKKGSKDRFIRVPCQLAIIFNLPIPS
jgi:hypothetical protein